MTLAAAVAPATPWLAVHTLAVNALAFDLPNAQAAVRPASPDPLIGVDAYVWAERLIAPAVAALAAAYPRAALAIRARSLPSTSCWESASHLTVVHSLHAVTVETMCSFSLLPAVPSAGASSYLERASCPSPLPSAAGRVAEAWRGAYPPTGGARVVDQRQGCWGGSNACLDQGG